MKTTQQAFKAVNWLAWAEMRGRRGEYAGFRLLNPGSAEYLIGAYIRPTTRAYLAKLEIHQSDARKVLRFIRDILASEINDNIPLRSSVCARMITEQVLSFMVDKVVEIQAHPPSFVLWHDVTDGIIEVVGSLLFAWEPEEATNSGLMRLIHTAQREYGLALTPHTQATSDARWKEEVMEVAQLLKADPSGFTLIDTVIAELHAQAAGRPINEQQRIERYQIPEFVIAGAEQAREIYKCLYPLTEDL